MKKKSNVFILIAVALSHVMCCVVAYEYRGMLCAIQHAGNSAPASIAFFWAIPFLIAILVCVVLAVRLRKK